MKRRYPAYAAVVVLLVLTMGFVIHYRFPGEVTPARVSILTVVAMLLSLPVLLWKRDRPPPNDDQGNSP
jgi:hypothetical protein